MQALADARARLARLRPIDFAVLDRIQTGDRFFGKESERFIAGRLGVDQVCSSVPRRRAIRGIPAIPPAVPRRQSCRALHRCSPVARSCSRARRSRGLGSNRTENRVKQGASRSGKGLVTRF
jgi:hypothetical protein